MTTFSNRSSFIGIDPSVLPLRPATNDWSQGTDHPHLCTRSSGNRSHIVTSCSSFTICQSPTTVVSTWSASIGPTRVDDLLQFPTIRVRLPPPNQPFYSQHYHPSTASYPFATIDERTIRKSHFDLPSTSDQA